MAGACRVISDASFPDLLFSYWAATAEDGRMSIPDLVRRQTREPARFAGLKRPRDTGARHEGRHQRDRLPEPWRWSGRKWWSTLPAGGRRLMQKARGYVATVRPVRSLTGTVRRPALCPVGWCGGPGRSRDDHRARFV